MALDVWRFRDSSARMAELDLAGFEVIGRDGTVGVVDKASNDVGASYLVVDAGDWLAGHTVMVPAWTVERIDARKRQVFLDRTRDELRDAPDYDREHPGRAKFQDRLTGYYHGLYDTGL